MKGIIFNLFEDFVTENFGLEVWSDVLETANPQSGKVFIAPKTYPDEDFLSLVSATVQIKDIDLSITVKSFGKFALDKLANRYEEFLTPHKSAKEFLLSMNSVIHVEIKKLFEGSEPPEFTYEDTAENKLTMHYSSKRKLCVLMEGFLEGVADYYGIRINYNQRRCMHKGDKECIFDLEFMQT
jgi:predicted hydrocarbon binding protein